MKMTLICMKLKLYAELIFIWKVSHLNGLLVAWRGHDVREFFAVWWKQFLLIWIQQMTSSLCRNIQFPAGTWLLAAFTATNQGHTCFLIFINYSFCTYKKPPINCCKAIYKFLHISQNIARNQIINVPYILFKKPRKLFISCHSNWSKLT